MSLVVKKYVPLLFFTISGLFILLSHYSGIAETQATMLSAWPVTLATFAIILGVATFLIYHSRKVARKEERWPYYSLSLVSFLVTFVSALASKPLFDYIVSNVVITLQIAILCFVGFYNYTLFFRATRIKTFEVGVLLVSAIFVMLWMAPVGEAISPQLAMLGKWINDVPNGGAMRGILMSIAIGMIGLFIRACLGYEKSYIGGE